MKYDLRHAVHIWCLDLSYWVSICSNTFTHCKCSADDQTVISVRDRLDNDWNERGYHKKIKYERFTMKSIEKYVELLLKESENVISSDIRVKYY